VQENKKIRINEDIIPLINNNVKINYLDNFNKTIDKIEDFDSFAVKLNLNNSFNF